MKFINKALSLPLKDVQKLLDLPKYFTKWGDAMLVLAGQAERKEEIDFEKMNWLISEIEHWAGQRKLYLIGLHGTVQAFKKVSKRLNEIRVNFRNEEFLQADIDFLKEEGTGCIKGAAGISAQISAKLSSIM